MRALQSDDNNSELMGNGEVHHEDGASILAVAGDCDSIPDRKSDEVLAATAILCVYEFSDAPGLAWNRHLSRTKSLLDIAQRQMASVEKESRPSAPQIAFSRARRAIFWSFARQDYLSGCEYL
jgi:hypothetical protein